MRLPKKLFQAKRFAIEEVRETLVILPLIDDDQACLIWTYRVAIDRWNLELPAGTLDKGLSPIETATLELQEETGFRASRIEHVHTFAMSPGILDEKMHFFVAIGLQAGESAREIGEQIDNRILTWSEIDRLLRDKQIIDAKTLVALLWYMRYRDHA
jgi:ADP-ribose pyrophosphatase